ncbi:MAG: lipid A biosynthesis acyltransferase [Betaproteobacteria bacterium]|nr:lipid A biosynthesis acyltransferase [Betaproteobacteria bacterium]
MLTRFALGLIWLAQWLPAGAIARLGRGIGWLGYRLAVPRRKVVLTNLRLCFPGLTEAERIALARRHFSALGRAIMERAVMWYAPLERVTQFVRLEEVEHFEAVRGRPVLLLAPHFVGLDMGGVRVAIAWRTASMYGKQKNPALDAAMRHGRERFGDPVLISRQDGIRPVVRALRDGFAFYYLPDMDFGPRESIFVPFFGVTTATVPALARLAQVSRARVVPVVTRQLPDGEGYAAKFYPAWEDFPTGDIDADTRRMNEFIEARVREMPEQYYWVHKRFKTRPAGEERIY